MAQAGACVSLERAVIRPMPRWFWPCLCLVGFHVVAAATMRLTYPVEMDFTVLHYMAYLFAPAAFIYFVWLLGRCIEMMRDGERSPLRQIKLQLDYTYFLAILMAAVHQSAFMGVKQTLFLATGFWADPVLAGAELDIFGDDPWRLSMALFGPFIGVIDAVYHLWFPGIALTFAWAVFRRNDQAVTAYFLLWTLGMLAQFLLPSGGPVFFERNGFGAQFAGIPLGPMTQEGSVRLWLAHSANLPDVVAGISAWPSMHVAMALWAAMVWRHVMAWVFLALIALGSVVLGWHYVADGVGGALIAAIAWLSCKRPVPVTAEAARC